MPRDEDSSYNYIDLTELAKLLTQAAVSSPVVTQAPANTAPSTPAVQKVVTQVAAAVAPIVAPNVPRAAINALAAEVTSGVVSNPTVVKADTGTSIPAKVVESIATTAVKSPTLNDTKIATLDSTSKTSTPTSVNTTTLEGIKAASQFGSSTPWAQAAASNTNAQTDRLAAAEAANTKNAADTIKALQDLGVGGEPTPASKNIQDRGIEGFGTGMKKISEMTQEEIDAITKAQIASGGQSNDQSLTILGETNAQRNARITAGYKNFLAKPVLTAEQEAAGVDVRFVRTEAGGVGSYTAVTPIGYTGPKVTATQWTGGIIPSNSPYISGTTLGVMSTGNGTYTTIPGSTFTNKTATGKVTNTDGSVTTFYSDGTSSVTPPPSVNTNNTATGNTATGGGSSVTTSGPTTNIEVLKSILRARGFSSSLVDSSASFLQQLLKDNLDYDNAVEVFLNSKDYTLKNGTKITSPFYETYGFLNESAPKPLSPDTLYGFVEGTKSLITKYGVNSKFASTEYLKGYIKNQVTVDDLAGRFNTARLKALESDTSYIEALKKLGFIATAADLTDFFADPKVGQETLIQNQRTGVFAAEALRRASAGVEFNKTLAGQMAAGYTAKGMSEAEIAASAATGYANIAENLKPMTKLSGIYEKGSALKQEQIQTELEQEEFMGMESARRKRLKETETKAYQGQSGTTQYSLRSRGTAGIL